MITVKENDKDYPYDGVYNNIRDVMNWFKTHYANKLQQYYNYLKSINSPDVSGYSDYDSWKQDPKNEITIFNAYPE